MSSTRQPVFASPEGVQRLEAAKAEQKLSFAAIAAAAGVSAKTVSRLFRGEAVLVASVEAITAVLGLEVEAIAQLPNPEADEGYAEAERRIQAAIANQATELDLSGLNLKAVPPELGQLAHLTELSLDQNQLTAVPPELGQLAHLTGLSLHQN
uniref:helix-turn-helix domain-containing protein n=1 Tax=Halomicronema sp. CCY15110 TaxID=2767773 RepID=UPI001951FBCB